MTRLPYRSQLSVCIYSRSLFFMLLWIQAVNIAICAAGYPGPGRCDSWSAGGDQGGTETSRTQHCHTAQGLLQRYRSLGIEKIHSNTVCLNNRKQGSGSSPIFPAPKDFNFSSFAWGDKGFDSSLIKSILLVALAPWVIWTSGFKSKKKCSVGISDFSEPSFD